MTVFITGTDTSIGKTLIAGWICLHTGASYWKPIQTGAGENTDADTDREMVKRLAAVPLFPEVYRLRNPLSPHAAAMAEGTCIDLEKLVLPPESRLVVEGAGGVLVPLTSAALLIDLVQSWSIPVIVVARSTLGTINHTCLTLEALRRRNIDVLGVVMNGPPNASNRQAIENFGKVTVLAEFPTLTAVSAKALETIPLSPELRTALKRGGI